MTQPSSGSRAAVWSESTPHLHFSARWNKSALNFSVSLVRDEELDELFNTNGCQVPGGQMSKWWMRKSAVNMNSFCPESCRKAAACALTLRASSFRPGGVLKNLFHSCWFRFPSLVIEEPNWEPSQSLSSHRRWVSAFVWNRTSGWVTGSAASEGSLSAGVRVQARTNQLRITAINIRTQSLFFCSCKIYELVKSDFSSLL